MFDTEHTVRKPGADGKTHELVVDLASVSKTYETGAGGFEALSNANVAIKAGEFVAIVGPSGSGKSTLLNMLTGIDRPTSGVARVNGTTLNELSENELARWRGTNVGLVFQFYQLMPTLTVVENVTMPMDFARSVPARDRSARALELLDLVGIADQADKFPATLSGGQQQRAAIARSLANDPPLLAADEPTGNLDSHTADSVLGLLRELSSSGKTVVMVTHERNIAPIVDRLIAVADGTVSEGPPRA